MIQNQRNSPTLSRCYQCNRPGKLCRCESYESFDTKTRFVILMHPKEARKQKLGTGRMTHLMLKNSELIIDLHLDKNIKFNELIAQNDSKCFLLYPSKNSININSTTETKALNDSIIFILDGTWPCAKSMIQKSHLLKSLPKISFNNNRQSDFKIKKQPHDFCLSTIESVHEILTIFNERGLENLHNRHDILMNEFQLFVQTQIAIASNPENQHYDRKPQNIKEKISKNNKWQKRSIIYSESNFEQII